jgi:hypothetical protein
MPDDKTSGNPAIHGGTSPSPSRAGTQTPKDPGAPSPKDPKRTSSPWKEFLDFLYDGGFRSSIALIISIGAIWITLENDKICKGAPSQEGGETIALVQPNPICSKYFELTFMIVGGYLGLSLPSSGSDR